MCYQFYVNRKEAAGFDSMCVTFYVTSSMCAGADSICVTWSNPQSVRIFSNSTKPSF